MSETELAALAAASHVAGPDASGVLSPRQGIALQAHVLHFDRYSAAERQPLSFGQGSVLTWDGRLDNRDDLLLRLHRDLGTERTDAVIVAAAYVRWGLESLRMLVGDWSVAIWDAPAQRLVLARDYMGNRPLYYREQPGGFAWATCLDGLVDAFGLASAPNERYIAGTFLAIPLPSDITPFAGVRRLPPGHTLVVTSAGSQLRRYFAFSPEEIKYSRPQDYVDHLRELLVEAVRVRLRKTGTAWAHLSGGWDSSSIVCIAHRLVANGGVDASALQPVSIVWRTVPEPDETEFISEVEQWCGLHTVPFEFRGHCTAADMLVAHRQPLGWCRHDCDVLVQRSGDRVVLSGLLGDIIMLNGAHARLALLHHLYQGHPLRFLQQCALSANTRNFPFLTTLTGLLRTAYGPSPQAPAATESPLFNPSLRKRAPERYAEPKSLLEGFSRLKRPLAETLYFYSDDNKLSSPDTAPNLWRTYPYGHRPLVEFMLAAPPLALWEPTMVRAGMQRALADVLPPRILARTDKNDAATPWERSKRRRSEEIASMRSELGPPGRWHLVVGGYIDGPALGRVLDAFPSIDASSTKILAHSILLEVWLRTLHTLSSSGTIRRDSKQQAGLAPDGSRLSALDLTGA